LSDPLHYAFECHFGYPFYEGFFVSGHINMAHVVVNEFVLRLHLVWIICVVFIMCFRRKSEIWRDLHILEDPHV
jgi:hypothetical protein